jgi:hypothetical protein
LRHAEAARSEAERSERRKRDLESALTTMAAEEEQRLSRGELTASDLARGAAWTLAVEIDRAEQARAVEQARAEQAAAEARATERRQDLAAAKTSAELVAKHQKEWQRARTAEVVAREDEDAEQAHLNRIGQRGAR